MHDDPIYRLYLFDHANRILRAEIIHADEDDAAIAKALTVPQNFGGELWDAARLVKAIDPNIMDGKSLCGSAKVALRRVCKRL